MLVEYIIVQEYYISKPIEIIYKWLYIFIMVTQFTTETDSRKNTFKQEKA